MNVHEIKSKMFCFTSIVLVYIMINFHIVVKYILIFENLMKLQFFQYPRKQLVVNVKIRRLPKRCDARTH